MLTRILIMTNFAGTALRAGAVNPGGDPSPSRRNLLFGQIPEEAAVDYMPSYSYSYDEDLDESTRTYDDVDGVLTVGTPVTGDTRSTDNTWGNPSNDEWFTFYPPTSGDYTFSTCGSKYDTWLNFFAIGGPQADSNSYSYSYDYYLNSSGYELISRHDDDGQDFCTYSSCTTECCLTTVTLYMVRVWVCVLCTLPLLLVALH